MEKSLDHREIQLHFSHRKDSEDFYLSPGPRASTNVTIAASQFRASRCCADQ